MYLLYVLVIVIILGAINIVTQKKFITVAYHLVLFQPSFDRECFITRTAVGGTMAQGLATLSAAIKQRRSRRITLLELA